MTTKFYILILVFSVFYVWEHKKPFAVEKRLSFVPNITLGAISLISSTALWTLWALFNNSVPTDQDLTVFEVLKTLLLLDLISYFWHQMSHSLPWLWQLHLVHHSEQRMESSSAFRFHFIEVLLSLLPRIGCIYFFSLPTTAVIIFEVLFQMSNIFQHANIQLSKTSTFYIELLFVTPSMHRNHHSIDKLKQQSNYATVFSFWDRFFKTYESAHFDQVQILGLDNCHKNLTIKELLFLPWKKSEVL